VYSCMYINIYYIYIYISIYKNIHSHRIHGSGIRVYGYYTGTTRSVVHNAAAAEKATPCY
jgi:hypothetical protein